MIRQIKKARAISQFKSSHSKNIFNHGETMEAIQIVAQLMEIAATTAPKSKGENFVVTKTVSGESLQALGNAMIAFGERTGKKDFDRDGKNVLNSAAVLLIGIAKATPLGLACGACGYERCKDLKAAQPVDGEFKGPVCAFRLLDLGIALGSAVKTASIHNVDNRIMYRAGAVARDMGLIDWDVVMGIPLSVSGKSIFFDR
jgi:uncharacterized ferredoxin-like protein